VIFTKIEVLDETAPQTAGKYKAYFGVFSLGRKTCFYVKILIFCKKSKFYVKMIYLEEKSLEF